MRTVMWLGALTAFVLGWCLGVLSERAGYGLTSIAEFKCKSTKIVLLSVVSSVAIGISFNLGMKLVFDPEWKWYLALNFLIVTATAGATISGYLDAKRKVLKTEMYQ